MLFARTGTRLDALQSLRHATVWPSRRTYRAEADIVGLIDRVEERYGPIDLFCSNAGIGVRGGAEVADDDWTRIWDINVMSHIWVARTLIPRMIGRGGGHLMITASARVFCLSSVRTLCRHQHAAVALAEWLSITHGDDGIKVSVLCPQGVRTAMTASNPNGIASRDGMMEPDEVAEACVQGLSKEEFLILPHPRVRRYMQRKAENPDRC